MNVLPALAIHTKQLLRKRLKWATILPVVPITEKKYVSKRTVKGIDELHYASKRLVRARGLSRIAYQFFVHNPIDRHKDLDDQYMQTTNALTTFDLVIKHPGDRFIRRLHCDLYEGTLYFTTFIMEGFKDTDAVEEYTKDVLIKDTYKTVVATEQFGNQSYKYISSFVSYKTREHTRLLIPGIDLANAENDVGYVLDALMPALAPFKRISKLMDFGKYYAHLDVLIDRDNGAIRVFHDHNRHGFVIATH